MQSQQQQVQSQPPVQMPVQSGDTTRSGLRPSLTSRLKLMQKSSAPWAKYTKEEVGQSYLLSNWSKHPQFTTEIP